MKTRLLALTILLLLVASACGSTRPVATVNGVDLERGDLLDQLAEDAATPGPNGDAAAATQIVTEFVGDELRRAEIERRDLDPGSIDDQLVIDLVFGGVDPGDDAELEEGREIAVLAYDLSGLELPGEERQRAIYDEFTDEFASEFCGQVVVLETEEEAVAALADLEGGAPFETVIVEYADDPSDPVGADLGCIERGVLVPELEQLMLAVDLNVWTGPTLTPIGYALVLATDRTIPDFEIVQADVRSALISGDLQTLQVAYQDWFTEAFAAADVDVDPRDFGPAPGAPGLVTPNGVTNTPQLAIP